MAGNNAAQSTGSYVNTDGSVVEPREAIERPALAPVVIRTPRRQRARAPRSTRAGPSEEDSPNLLASFDRDCVASELTDADRRMIDFLIEEALKPWL